MFRLNRWESRQTYEAVRFADPPSNVAQDTVQMAFAGVHSDIGGGYPEAESGLSKFPLAWLTDEAAAQAGAADTALEAAQTLLRDAIDEARRGQAAVVSGPDDPAAALETAALGFEAAATPLADAHAALVQLGWTLRAIDPRETSPPLGLQPADLVAVGTQWLAAALPSAALSDMRRQAESTLDHTPAATPANNPAP